MFSVVNAVLLRPLPFMEPERLVTVWERNPKQGYDQNAAAPANFADWKRDNQVFQEIAAFDGFTAKGMNLTGAGDPERVSAALVSANLFQLLGTAPMLGRGFSFEEETPGQDRVVVLSHGLWQRRFGAEPDIVGKPIMLDNKSCTVVGVMPRGFAFPGGTGVILGSFSNDPADLWLPLALSAEATQRHRSKHYLQVIARLKDGVTLEQAGAQMDALMQGLEQANRGSYMGTHCLLVPLREQAVAHTRAALLVLLGAVAFVLLIACANVANLLLARAAARQKEIAIRIAMGAGRQQILRQLLTESVLLALIGAALGTLLAICSVRLIIATVGGNVAVTTPGWSNIGIDGNVLIFTLTVSFLVGVLFGLAPAWQATKAHLNEPLKEGGRSSTEGTRRNRLRSGLVIGEVATAMVLLVGAALMLQSFVRLQRTNPGFSPAGVLTFELGLSHTRFAEEYQRAAFVERLLERLRALPGVVFPAATTGLPLEFAAGTYSYEVVGQPSLEPGKWQTADMCSITPDYLRAMQIPLRSGRPFDIRDTKDSPPVCLINQTLADRHFRHEDPIGKRIRTGQNGFEAEIVGVVQDVKFRSLDSAAQPKRLRALFEAGIYVPYPQLHSLDTVYVLLRTIQEPKTLASTVRGVVRGLDKDQPIAKLRTMETVLRASIAQPRFRTLLLTLFGGLAVVLAAIGIYGVISYSVTQRTHEFGIRMALGAQAGDVLRLVLRHGMRMALTGIGCGVVGAMALTRVISGLLFGVKATDPGTFIAVAILLAVIAFFASFVPARRATKVHPMEALRYE